METPRIDELIAQVVAWHNRLRLARPITSAQVRSIGVVVLPFVSTEGSDATATAAGQRLVPAFSEDFIAPLTPKQVASFAAKHGSRDHPGAAAWSQRVVPADARHASAELALIYLRTACIELGEHRCRVLIGAGPQPRIIGPRAWSVPRIAGASAAATALLGGTVMAMLLVGAPPPPETRVVATAPAHPASASVSVSAPAFASTSASASASAAETGAASAASARKIDAPVVAIAASAPAPAASVVAPAASAAARSLASSHPPASAPARSSGLATLNERNADAASRRSAVPVIRPMLSSEARAFALLEGKRLRAMAPANPPVAAAPAAGHVYAVMTVATRTRALAERSHLVMDSSALAGELPGQPRSELMQVTDGWRAVLWPFRNRDDAKLAQAMLSERGIRTDVLEF